MLLHAPSNWSQSFDFVLESYTLQALPSSLLGEAIDKIVNFVAPAGQLLVISRGREAQEDAGNMPYPLTQNEVIQFVSAGLSLIEFEDYLDEESPSVRRFRTEFKRYSAA